MFSVDIIKEKLKNLPQKPGCYLMYNQNHEIIYVGKAKNLKNRVRSYFTGSHNAKTTKLVSEIQDFSYVQTNSERESLILELHLIKEHNPRYNIKLTDDSTYPFIMITNEKDPRLVVVRESNKKDGKLFGPYPNAYAARETAKLLNKIYPLRKCDTMPKKACLYFHLGQCLAPCIKKEPIDYKEMIAEITSFLKGDTKKVLDLLKNEMYQASELLQFERAQEAKEMILHITSTTEKQLISLNDFKDRDFIGYHYDEEDCSIQILKMRQGKIIDVKSDIFPYVSSLNDAVMSYVMQTYENERLIPDELLFQDSFDENILVEVFGKKAMIPKIGDKKKLVDMAFKNAKYDLENHRLLYKISSEKTKEATEAFKSLLGLSDVRLIEVFDNAHLFGSAPISAMVVFKDGKPFKKAYRKYHIKTATPGDDYGQMKEVIYRRYQKQLMQKEELPDLIVVDGGKIQVNAAKEVLSSLGLEIPVIGLQKNQKHTFDRIYYETQSHEIKKATPLYTYLAKMSEEVHRFAITFHKNTRARTLMRSHLDGIKGVGEARKKALLEKFVTIDQMKIGDIEDYQSIGINEKLRETIINHLLDIEKKGLNEENHT